MAIWVGHQLVHAVETETGYRIELGDRSLAEGATKKEALDNATEVLRAEGTLFEVDPGLGKSDPVPGS